MVSESGSSRSKTVKVPAKPLTVAVPATDEEVHRMPMAVMFPFHGYRLPKGLYGLECSSSSSGIGSWTVVKLPVVPGGFQKVCQRTNSKTSSSSNPEFALLYPHGAAPSSKPPNPVLMPTSAKPMTCI